MLKQINTIDEEEEVEEEKLEEEKEENLLRNSYEINFNHTFYAIQFKLFIFKCVIR